MDDRAAIKIAPRAVWLAALTLATALAASPWAMSDAHAAAPKDAELQARKAFTAGDYDKALTIYVDLYTETGHPTYLRNIARCHQNLGHADKAIAGFREYLRKAKDLTPDQKAEVQKYIAEMEELRKKEAGTAPAASATRRTARADDDTQRARTGPELSVAATDDREAKPASVDLAARPAPEGSGASERSPFYTRVWFWAGVGVLAAGAVAAVLLVGVDRGPAYGNLGHVDVPSGKP